MLHESHPWKCELAKLKSELVQASAEPLSEDAPDFNLEKPLLYSAIVVRRLIESWRVTDKTRALSYSVETYPPQPDRLDALMHLTMKGNVDVEFNLSAPQTDSMDAWEITSELLHSGFINWEVDDESRFVAIYLASK